MGLPQVKDVSDFHCVTSWSRMDNQWEGVRFKTLAEKAKLKPSVKFVYITGHDGYSTNLKLQECLDDDVLIVHHWNGIPLPREHGGPARMITPRKIRMERLKMDQGDHLFRPRSIGILGSARLLQYR